METQLARDTLQRGDLLSWYRIERVLGRGGFGITYLATDTNLDRLVAIKEYLPDEFAERDPDNSIRPSTPAYADTFKWGLDSFITEAKTLVKFKHPNIVQVFSVFEQNSTAYLVMEFEQGCDLKEYLKRPNTNTEENLKTLFAPIIEGLQQVHAYGFTHRDIKPANIYIRDNGTPVLLDFGSARQTTGDSTKMLTSLVTVGYTPLEQYSEARDNSQGPWTDIYAMGAVLYYAITGATPVDSTRRGSAILNGSTDPLKPLRQTAKDGYSQPFLSAIDWALAFAVADRPRNLEQWADSLFSSPALQQHQPADDSTVMIPTTEKRLNIRSPQNNQTPPDPASIPLNDPAADAPWELNNSPAPINQRKTRPEKKTSAFLPVMVGLMSIAILGTAGWLWKKNSGVEPLNSVVSNTNLSAAVTDPADTAPDSSATSTTEIATSVTDRSITQPAITASEVTKSLELQNLELRSLELQSQELQSQATEQLQALLSAINSADIEQLKQISSFSSTTERLLTIVFEGQATIDASIVTTDNNVTTRQLANDSARIDINTMTDYSGSITAPALSYKSLNVKLNTTGSDKPMIEIE